MKNEEQLNESLTNWNRMDRDKKLLKSNIHSKQNLDRRYSNPWTGATIIFLLRTFSLIMDTYVFPKSTLYAVHVNLWVFDGVRSYVTVYF